MQVPLWKQAFTHFLWRRGTLRRAHILAVLLFCVCAIHSPPARSEENLILEAARQAEKQLDARVGVAIYDTGSGASWQYRANERFPMTSTFKVLACGALLARADNGLEDLNRSVQIRPTDFVAYSPVTEGWSDQHVPLYKLCEATLLTSDNTAANKVLEALGGPHEVTAFLRSIGDEVTRLDRWETQLNEATPGDARDTTTPAAIATSLRKLVLGDVLSLSAKTTLTQWLVDNKVGGPLLRAGIPADWQIADRTGAGGHGSRGIVAVVWPPDHAPMTVAVYITQTRAAMEQRNEAIASIGSALAETLRLKRETSR